MSAAQISGADAAPATAIDVTQHMGLVHSVAHRYARAARGALDYDDLAQAGALGAMRAARTFDPSRAAWSTYARFWIRQHIQRTLADQGATVRVPVGIQERRRKRGELMRAQCVSLDAPVGSGSDSHLDHLADEGAESPDALADREQDDMRRALARIMSAADLTLRQRRVLYARVVEGRTLDSIAPEYGVTRQAIANTEHAALAKLRRVVRILREESPL